MSVLSVHQYSGRDFIDPTERLGGTERESQREISGGDSELVQSVSVSVRLTAQRHF